MITALLVGFTASRPLVAFTARIYFPPGDKRISRFQVYVCDLEGKNRRQLTHEAQDCDDVRWYGKGQLTYVVDRHLLKRIDLKTGTITLLASYSNPAYLYGEGLRCGREQRGKPRYVLNEAIYEIVGKRLIKANDVAPDLRKPFELSSPDPSNPATLKYDPQTHKAVLSGQGKSITVADGNANESFVDAFVWQKRTYLITYFGNSTNRGSYDVSKLDWMDGSKTTVAEGADLDFAPGRSTWAYVTTRGTARYEGKKEVWVSEAHVVRDGKELTVVQGLQDATSISVSPEAP